MECREKPPKEKYKEIWMTTITIMVPAVCLHYFQVRIFSLDMVIKKDVIGNQTLAACTRDKHATNWAIMDNLIKPPFIRLKN